jgi:hypothetical protein
MTKEPETIEDLIAEGRCPECGTLQGIWHKLGCSHDTEPEVVETETVPEAELVAYEEPSRDLKGASSAEELEKVIQDHIINDFEQALNLIRSYQTLCKRALVPDLHWQEAHDLLAKYRMESVEPSVRIVDPEYGDITTHTTSVKGDAEEIVETVIEETSSIEIYDDGSDPNFTYHLTIKPDQGTDIDAMHARRADRPPPPEPERPEEGTIEQLRLEGYVDCPICEGTGKATKGVLKGKKCSRCGGYGVWKQPETATFEGDDTGNFRLRPTGGQPDDPEANG